MDNRILAKYISAFITGLAVCAIAGSAVYAVTAFLITVIFIKLCRERNPENLIRIAAVFAVGMMVFSAAAAKSNAEVEKFGGRYVEVYGRVTEPPKNNNESYMLTLEQMQIRYGGKVYKSSGYVRIYCNDRINYRAGDLISASGKYTCPQENRNTGGFNYRTYLKTDDIRAMMFVSRNGIRFMEYKPSWRTYASAARQWICNRITTNIGGEQGELVKAVITGDKTGFTQDMKNNFSDCGVSHIVAVSGMHMAMLIMFVMRLGRILGIKRKLRSLSAIVFILLYVSVLGFVPSAIRAAVMGIAVMLAELLNRREDFITSVLMGAAVILLINPYSIFDAGFLLSFSAVIGIHLFAPAFDRIFSGFLPRPIRAVLSMSIAANLMTLPVTATVFNKINLVGFAANILIVPVLEFIFIGGIITAVVPYIGIITAFPVKVVATLVLELSEFLSELKFINISVMTPNLLMLAANAGLLLLVYGMVHRKGLKKICTAAGAFAVLTAICVTVHLHEQKAFRVEFINVGQGDSVLISSAGKNFMIDTGRENSSDSLEYLKDRGITALDVLFITHSDSDHSGGAKKLADGIKIEKAVFPHIKMYDPVLGELEKYFLQKGTDVQYAAEGDSFTAGDGRINVFMPGGSAIEEDYQNNNCLVMEIEYKEKVFLMMGDAGTEAENILMEKHGNLKADVLKVGHHGSANSTSEAFLSSVAPQYAVLSCGVNNYGHPAEETVSRLESCGSIIYRTDESGNVVFKINRDGSMKAGDIT